jgi:hypothetical protein
MKLFLASPIADPAVERLRGEHDVVVVVTTPSTAGSAA